MLRHTFVHVPGVGQHIERALWQAGCLDWDCFLAAPRAFPCGAADRGLMVDLIARSREALEAREHQFFARLLGMRESWRAWADFRDAAVYLDIETDGGRGGDCVTCVGLYNGSAFRCLVKDVDLGVFPDAISLYGCIVTFFGSGFDIPTLSRAFPMCPFDHIHIDLCHVGKRLGLSGGLKRIEAHLGLQRSEETRGLTGYDAVRLWRRHLSGDPDALRLLVEYNRMDVVNLEAIAQLAYDRLRAQAFAEAGVVSTT